MPNNSISGVPVDKQRDTSLRVMSSLLREAVLGRRLRVTEAVRVPVLRARPLVPEMAEAMPYAAAFGVEGGHR